MFQHGNVIDEWFTLNKGNDRRGDLNLRVQMVGALAQGQPSSHKEIKPVHEYANIPPAKPVAATGGYYEPSAPIAPPAAMPAQQYAQDPMNKQQQYVPHAAMPQQQYAQASMQQPRQQPMMHQQQQPPMMQQQYQQHQQPMMQQQQHAPSMYPGQMARPAYDPRYDQRAQQRSRAPP